MTDIVKVVLTTQNLKELLADHPDRIVEIQDKASVKIADEFYKKVAKDWTPAKVSNQIDDIFSRLIRDNEERLKKTWTFPEGGKAIIKEITTTTLNQIRPQFSNQMMVLVNKRIDAVVEIAKSQIVKALEEQEMKIMLSIQDEINQRVTLAMCKAMQEQVDA